MLEPLEEPVPAGAAVGAAPPAAHARAAQHTRIHITFVHAPTTSAEQAPSSAVGVQLAWLAKGRVTRRRCVIPTRFPVVSSRYSSKQKRLARAALGSVVESPVWPTRNR